MHIFITFGERHPFITIETIAISRKIYHPVISVNLISVNCTQCNACSWESAPIQEER